MDKLGLANTVLKYWYLVEFLDQPNFPVGNTNQKAAKEYDGKKQITLHHTFTCTINEPSMPALLLADTEKFTNHSILADECCICIGKVKRTNLVEYLKRKFSLEDDAPEKDTSMITLIGLKCDGEGCYVEKSFSVSPLVWGIARLKNHNGHVTGEQLSGLLSVESYRKDMLAMEDMLVSCQEDANTAGNLLTADSLHRLLDHIIQSYLSPLSKDCADISRDGVLIYKRYQTEEAKAKDNAALYHSDLSKSFFTNDLQMVGDAISSRAYGKAGPMEQSVIDYIVGPYAENTPDTGWIDFSQRTDIRQLSSAENRENQKDFFNDHLDVMHAPLGKWPSRYMPSFMQQLAVNLGMQPQEGGILSVNGPPGTGKTTLLKEIIAGNIVERAKLLCAYEDPDEAFERKKFYDGEKTNNGYNQYHSAYYDFIDDGIKDYGMLVASCNNAAVENITKELPDGLALCGGLAADKKDSPDVRAGLDEVRALFELQYAPADEHEDMDNPPPLPDIYFTKCANKMAGKKEEKDWDRWGLISAPFGKTDNLNNYAYKVLLPLINNEYRSNDSINNHKSLYLESVEQFNSQLARVEALRQEIGNISHARADYARERANLEGKCKKLTAYISLKRQMLNNLAVRAEDFKSRLAAAQTNAATAITAVDAAELNANQWQHNVQESDKEIKDITDEIIKLESRLGFTDFLRNLFNNASTLSLTIQEKKGQLTQKQQVLAEKKKSYKNALDALHGKQKAYNDLVATIEQLKLDQQDCERKTAQFHLEIEKSQQEITALKQQIQKKEEDYREILRAAAETEDILEQMTVLDDAFWEIYNSPQEAESTMAQVSNPWFTIRYNREREKLFYAALQVHKNFLLGSKHCRDNIKNLLVLWRITGDEDNNRVKMSQRDRENCFAALLNTVFLLTPVLSTTFASAGIMLADIKTPGEIGLLIIDEAGQAQPQMAIGALYRCRRAVVVGDPKQVEPVVTGEMDAIKKIIRNDINALYQSKTHSVQAFADRINPIGSSFSEAGGEEETWVGCPLVVHRRCISPMYEISNAISYDGTMKQQTRPPKPEKEAGFCLPGSQWINVCGSANNSKAKDHYVKAQGERALELILLAFTKTAEIPSLYVITPFTTVKNGLLTALETIPQYRSDPRFKQWAEEHIGTVHTFQGKEADEVIFLLGCDKNSISAVRWVNNNIVNVAVTRAKYRLYIVGDYAVWQHSYVMQQAKRIMDSHALRQLNALTQNPAEADAHTVEALLGQLPGAETFRADDCIGDELVYSFREALNDIWADGDNVTDEQLGALYLSADIMDELAPQVKQNVAWAIKLYYLFGTLTRQYKIKHMDFSCAGILFCKSMELHLKECMLTGLQKIFPDLKMSKGRLCELSKQHAMIGVFTYVLKDTDRREQLAEKQLTHSTGKCDTAWWKQYYDDLEAFRQLRNKCCHPEKFAWDDLSALLRTLFINKGFHKTMIGIIL